MRRLSALIMLSAGALVLLSAGSTAAPDPTPVPYGYDYLPPGGYVCPSIADLLGRASQLLGAIDSPQERTRLAEEWLDYSKKIIAKDMEYRQQWLELQRQQLSQQQKEEQLRLEIARLQLQLEQLRARNAQLEHGNQPPGPAPAPSSGGQSPPAAPPTPSLR
jgi:hypothetical protein